MYYDCPFCHSMKQPKVINYFPPKVVQCRDCHKTASEEEFLKEEEHIPTPLHNYH